MTVTKRVRMRLTAGHQNDAKLNNLFLIYSLFSSSNPRKSTHFLGLEMASKLFLIKAAKPVGEPLVSFCLR